MIKGGFQIRNLKPSQSGHIRGLHFGPGPTEGLFIKDNGGKVIIESCVIRGAHGDNLVFGGPNPLDGADGALVQTSAAVTFIRFELYGGIGPDLQCPDPTGPLVASIPASTSQRAHRPLIGADSTVPDLTRTLPSRAPREIFEVIPRSDSKK